METLIDKARQITKWSISLIVCMVFSICAVMYFGAVEGLDKPAGINEAFEFLINSPGEYFLCLFCGGIAKVSVLVMLVVAVAALLCFIDTLLNGTSYCYSDSKNRDLIYGIANWILLMIMANIQSKIIVDYWILVVLIVVLLFVLKAIFDSN